MTAGPSRVVVNDAVGRVVEPTYRDRRVVERVVETGRAKPARIGPTWRLVRGRYPRVDREPGVGEPERARLVRVPRQFEQRWGLTGPYLDLVWAAHLGPTATLVARHLGYALARSAVVIDLAELGASVGRGDDRSAGRRHVVRAFERLSAARIVSWSPRTATITLSGYIAPAPPELLARFPAPVRAMHECLQATLPPAAPGAHSVPTLGAGGPSATATRPGERGRGGGGLGR